MTDGKDGPDIIHVGYSKSASSWLRNLLGNDEQIDLIIDARYFSRLIENPDLDQDAYLKKFERSEGDERLRVESDEHILSPIVHPDIDVSVGTFEAIDNVFQQMSKVLPETKVIVITRDPTEMVLSKYSQFILQGGSISFEQFFENLFDEKYSYSENYQFDEVQKIIHSYYPPERTLILEQQKIKGDSESAVQDIEKFIGLSLANKKLGHRKVNVGFSPWGLRTMGLLNKTFVSEKRNQFHDTQTRMIPTFVWYRLQNLVRGIDHRFVKNRSRSGLLTVEMNERLGDLFQ